MSNGATNETKISAEVEITGTIKSSGSISIDGKLDGELDCAGDAFIGQSANIKGNMSVNAAVISGTVNGNINAKDKIEMKSTAKVNGDIKAKRLSVEDGVMFIGKSEVNPSGAAMPSASSAPKPQSNGTGEKKDESSKGGVFGRK